MLTALLAGVLAATLLTSTTTASAAAKTVYIPARWTQTGEVPWAANRTRESTNFILLWGERSGTNPVSAPSPYNFDPNSVINQLENLYSFYVNTMKFTPEAGLLAQHKIIVIITRTWDRSNLEAWATGGSVDGRVGIINIAPGAALPGSWGLAHELAHVFQNYTFLGRSGHGFTAQYAGTFWETSAEFMAMQALPTTAAGDLTRWLRSENLYWSSSRHHYGNWMLMQYVMDRDGLAMFNRMWNEARNNEHPLEVYRRITGITQAELNRRVGEYATRNVTWDFGNRSTLMPFINNVYGAGFLHAYNGGQVEAVDAGAGHFRMNTRAAPSDYGFNKIKMAASDGALVKVRVKGHAETGATGWTFGLVALRNGTPRYSPLVVGADGQITFQLQSGEREVYLVVTGTPNAVPHYAFLDGYNSARRFPYEFRVSGATPSGFEPGYVKPAAIGGGHWHSNGGGWVANSANVAASAYVGPKAAVFGRATVTGNARIEGLGWVNGGVVGGNAVVKDNALIQDGANLSGNVVVGGDAEFATACGSGTYLRFNPDRRCDGGGGETDVNPTHGTFPTSDLSLS